MGYSSNDKNYPWVKLIHFLLFRARNAQGELYDRIPDSHKHGNKYKGIELLL